MTWEIGVSQQQAEAIANSSARARVIKPLLSDTLKGFDPGESLEEMAAINKFNRLKYLVKKKTVPRRNIRAEARLQRLQIIIEYLRAVGRKVQSQDLCADLSLTKSTVQSDLSDLRADKRVQFEQLRAERRSNAYYLYWV